jgi:hypothetical protein
MKETEYPLTAEAQMPRGIPKSKEGISKLEGVRRALGELGWQAGNGEIQSFLKSRFAIRMDTTLISNYKSMIKAQGNKSAMIRQPSRPAPGLSVPGGITLDDIRAVKEVVDKVGADKVRQLTEVLGK